ncbi:hypothetical protein JOD54_000502 [Actinokineospora baliensis]|uniref:LppU/SCO3897 family protein n=1 Tax=Actinokineospora baliensis TaxID=547056 RepID=UPI00195700A0|nr:hypothetical protein [Actinokineospora baliensis]MBM7770298.1 hypothetical protein [Actinokineospora baliensis]
MTRRLRPARPSGSVLIWPVVGLVLMGLLAIRAAESDEPAAVAPAAPTPTISTTAVVDDVDRAQVGNCFRDLNSGDTHDFRLTDCGYDTYELLARLPGSADTCPSDKANWSARSHDTTLCLRYRYPGGTGNLEVGECATRTPGGKTVPGDCRPGAFTVSGKHYKTADAGKCGKDIGFAQPHPSRAELDVVLCLRYRYIDDTGAAEVRNCLTKVRENGVELLRFGDCVKGNLYLTGRTKGNNKPYCATDVAVFYDQPQFPELDYTVCLRWI